MNICSSSLAIGIFPDRMKVAKVTPTFTKGAKCRVSNYRSLFAFPYFSKILERVMYSRPFDYLNVNNNLFNKQLEHRAGHSTEHAILEQIDLIYDLFNHKIFF